MDNETEKKFALVTGANKGLGFEISRQLGFAGFDVYMCGRNEGRLNQAAGMLRGEGHRMIPTVLDVTRAEDIERVAESLRSDGVRLDALVNNAAILLDENQSLLEVSDQAILETFQTNALGPLRLTRTLAPLLKDGARIVMVSSEAGAFCNGISNYAPVYSMSKTAMNVVTRRFALALASRRIAVNAASPGDVRTSMGGPGATRSVGEGAETPVWLATEVPLESTGKFWRDKEEIAW